MRKTCKKIIKKSGLKSEILRLKKGVAPIVYGEIKSRQNPTKTLMFYNHYDVQPAEPFDLWDYPPFSGTRKGNKIFGRGATDDKGELITRIKAVEACLKIGYLGLNLRVLRHPCYSHNFIKGFHHRWNLI